jgi:hypothetical protein
MLGIERRDGGGEVRVLGLVEWIGWVGSNYRTQMAVEVPQNK